MMQRDDQKSEHVKSERRAIVAEAHDWLRTPYHHMARLKGIGVDCATLLAEVYPTALNLPRIAVDYYPQEWHLHRDDERFMNIVKQYAKEIEPSAVDDGDIVLFRIGRAFAHGAIVVKWPVVIHAYFNRTVTLEDVSLNSELRERPMKFFSRWSGS